ncbi:type I-F CRISPR-associated protein Csy1 [Pseudomonas citronellolis]|uniref:Type I-F CRISPR-associated protein Csy1 n=1 Tax=Pseudomonas citronellolis TaxID=53408 RepID=A0A1A9K4W0_9PSED|nr:type I-F CRISPR-associated protein Csy1 [Pseudomonas citronellolis]ANI12625.1 type I-F CRISPR-associated protein Csy1 [Pseudomonas citronellolis]
MLQASALALRQAIQSFIDERLQAKLDKLRPDDEGKRQALIEGHRREAWLADAARRVGQIQMASHTLKPIHPDARGSNLYVMPESPKPPGLVGTHSLKGELAHDVVGNAAALDVFKFLNLELEGRSLLQRLLDDEPQVLAALSEESSLAREWRDAFVSITRSKGKTASHTLAKQLYFPLAGGDYHLLAPLFPTSLAHKVQQTLRADRFGEAARAAREARAKGEGWPHGYREYPNLAIQNFGGTKPQNISQLNSERHGENWLLASLPPQWESPEVRLPLDTDSVFPFLARHDGTLRRRVRELRDFLAHTSHNNLAMRRKRERLLGDICDRLLHYAAQVREPSGWSARQDCRLHDAERLWLDPLRGRQDEIFSAQRVRLDWPQQVGQRFANWLNQALGGHEHRLGEDEARQWTHDLHKELQLLREELEYDPS